MEETKTDSNVSSESSLPNKAASTSLNASRLNLSLESVSDAILWRNKNNSCETLRSFEAKRKSQIDSFQEKDRLYWEVFSNEIMTARQINTKLIKFFYTKVQMDLDYAENLRKLRTMIETPVMSYSRTSSKSDIEKESNIPRFSSTSIKALNSLGELQQELSEKIIQSVTVIKRDLITSPLEEMATTYENKALDILKEGTELDSALHNSLKRVKLAFSIYDTLYREMEIQKAMKEDQIDKAKKDLWLAELNYTICINQLKRRRVEYVQGMATLFQQYKVRNESCNQLAVDKRGSLELILHKRYPIYFLSKKKYVIS